MQSKLKEFYRSSFRAFFEGLINILIFLPYFFSLKQLLRTLFLPWKNLVAQKTEVGFSFSEYFNRLSFNVMSRLIGAVMRLAILLFYLILQIVILISIPIVILLYILLIPLLFAISLTKPTPEEKKQSIKADFMSKHLINPVNQKKVEEWFEHYYHAQYEQEKWWKLSSLMATPPIGHDWAYGYTPTLDRFTQDLTDPAYLAKLSPVIARELQIEQVERILSKGNEANVLLVGDEGIGKHTIVDALAKQIYEGKTTELLAFKRILKLNMDGILAEFEDMKKREVFLDSLFAEAAGAANVILVIDRIDKYTTNEQGHLDMSSQIEKYAKGSEMQIIGITTPYLYERYIRPFENIGQHFVKEDIPEITKAQAEAILLNSIPRIEAHYGVYIPYETLEIALDKSDVYITTIPYPEKTVKLLDSACVYTNQMLKKTIVTPDTISIVLEELTHIPTTINSSMRNKLLTLEATLSTRIIHQEEAVKSVTSTLQQAFVDQGTRHKPLCTFIFLGPTGVGKTETAKAISAALFGANAQFIRFDMSLYQSKSDISKLIGSADTGNPGLLTAALRAQPYGVLLLDEIEKADHDLLNIFLTMLDEGYYSDGYGRRVDCKNLVIIATSNAGASLFYQSTQSTGSALIQTPPTTKAVVDHLVEKGIFLPEFLNRFDGIIAFHGLTKTMMVDMARAIVGQLATSIYANHKIKLQISDAKIANLISTHYDPAFGARDLQRILKNEIDGQVARQILAGQIQPGQTLSL